MKQILSKWSLMRFLRLLIGIVIIVQAVIARDILFGIAGLFFTALPVLNIGCCGTGSCYVPPKKSTSAPKEIAYEELG